MIVEHGGGEREYRFSGGLTIALPAETESVDLRVCTRAGHLGSLVSVEILDAVGNALPLQHQQRTVSLAGCGDVTLEGDGISTVRLTKGVEASLVLARTA